MELFPWLYHPNCFQFQEQYICVKTYLEKKFYHFMYLRTEKRYFPIHASYRFVLLCVRNSIGPDKFPAGFYLHHLTTLTDQTKEKEKFGTLSKSKIIESPRG